MTSAPRSARIWVDHGHLDAPPAEHQRDFHLVSLRQEFACVTRFRGEVVLFDSRTEFHFLQVDHVLLFLCLPRHLRLFELELPIVHDSDDRGTSQRSDFDEIQPLLYRGGQR